MPKLKHYDDTGAARFVTFSCHKEYPLLKDDSAKELLISEIKSARKKYNFKVIGYAIMPNHVHLVLIPPEGMKLGPVIGEIKSMMARKYFARNTGSIITERIFWKRRCYDHNCRSLKAVVEKIEYCHKNPIKHGLVDSLEKYKWTSYGFYQEGTNTPLDIDEFEP